MAEPRRRDPHRGGKIAEAAVEVLRETGPRASTAGLPGFVAVGGFALLSVPPVN